MTDLRFGTVSAVGAFSAWRIVDDLDATTALPVDVWTLPNAPTVGDRVLYRVVQGMAVVLANITSPFRVATGSTAVTIATANTAASTPVTFPVGLFTAVPVVTCSPFTGPPGGGSVFGWPSAVTAAGCTINAMRSNTTTTTISWHAIQV